MTRFLHLWAIGFLFTAGCGGPQQEDKETWRSFTATAYSVDGKTSSGATTREGRTVAADLQILPLGTEIEIRGAGDLSGRYVVQDKGPKVRGRRIDIFVSSPKEAREFGKKAVELRIVRKPEGST